MKKVVPELRKAPVETLAPHGRALGALLLGPVVLRGKQVADPFCGLRTEWLGRVIVADGGALVR